MPYNSRTDRSLRHLAELAPTTLATMHGSTFVGDGTKAIGDLAVVLREIGLFGFLAMALFLAILVVGFLYEWMKGALEWE